MSATRRGFEVAGGTESITETVIMKVAEAEGVGPLEIPPLEDAVDTDALESLFSDTWVDEGQRDVRVEFSYCGYEIAVEGDRGVEILDG